MGAKPVVALSRRLPGSGRNSEERRIVEEIVEDRKRKGGSSGFEQAGRQGVCLKAGVEGVMKPSSEHHFYFIFIL